MKNLIASLFIITIIFLSAGAALFGLSTMIYNLYSGTNLLTGFIVFSLGSILFALLSIAYMISKILTSTAVTVDILENIFKNKIEKDLNNKNTLSDLFNKFGANITEIKIAKIDEEGNLSSVENQNIPGLVELIKELNNGPIGEIKLEDMNIEELNYELKKDLDKQSYERAAKIRDLIQEKKNSKS